MVQGTLKKISFKELIKSCDIGLSSVIIKKNIFDEKKILFPNLKTKEDYVLWLKLAKENVGLYGLQENLSYWRKTNNSLSSSVIQKLIDGYRVYSIYLGFNFFKSLFCLITLSLNFMLKKNDMFFFNLFKLNNINYLIFMQYLKKKKILLSETGEIHQKFASKNKVPLLGGAYLFLSSIYF